MNEQIAKWLRRGSARLNPARILEMGVARAMRYGTPAVRRRALPTDRVDRLSWAADRARAARNC